MRPRGLQEGDKEMQETGKTDRKADRYALVIAFRCDMMWVSPSLVRRQEQGLGFHS